MIPVRFRKGVFKPRLHALGGTLMVEAPLMLRGHIFGKAGVRKGRVYLLEMARSEWVFAVVSNPNTDPIIVSVPKSVITFWSRKRASHKLCFPAGELK